jgi:cobalt/nickel transport system ATP-binding protein
MSPAIEVRNLRFNYYDGTTALAGVSLEVATGECVGIVGPSGAGKSTLLLHLNGILPERFDGSSSVVVNGIPVGPASLQEVHRQVGFLFQDSDDQLFCPTVFEDVAFGPRQFGVKEEEIQKTVQDALLRVGLDGFGPRAPHHLSGGEKQLVCLAGILACRPSVLVLDEPAGDLDPRGRRRIMEFIRQDGSTRIIASHDLELVVELCSRVYVLDHGVVVASGSTERVLGNEDLMVSHGLEKPHILRHRHPHRDED